MLRYLLWLIAAAMLPALLLMTYIFKKDRVEKEPRDLLVRLMVLGAVFSFIPALLETVGDRVLAKLVTEGSALYYAVDAFLIVALSEEGMKRWVLRRKTWNNVNFNCSFDAIVYAAYISLGFALLENLIYVFGRGISGSLSTALLRAVTAIPAHFFNAVFMGLFFGRAKECQLKGDTAGQRRNMTLSLWVPVLLHGAYDFLAFLRSGGASALFTLLLVVLYIISFRTVRRESDKDHYLTGTIQF